MRAKAIALAEVTANSAVPALEFEDEAVLLEFLNGVARDSDVVQVAACGSDGAVLRSLGAAPGQRSCPSSPTTRVEMIGDRLQVISPIAAKTHPGTLLIAFRTDTIVRARQDAERVALAIAAGIILLGFGVSWWIAFSLLRLQGLLEENRLARARAEAANEAKSAFLASMSHEIRTPMNGVIGVAQLLAESPLNDAQRRHVSTISRSGELLLAVINDILDFSKVEAGKLTIASAPVAIRPLVSEVCDLVSAAARAKGLELQESIASDLPEAVLGDDQRLRQILLNLLSNAIKFTERGSVSVKVRKSPDAERLRFEVVDTGIGIPESHHATLFDAFTQVEDFSTRRHGGTGLGLAICKRFVTLMHGTLGVESTAGAGSSFWFELPLVSAEPALPTAPKVSRAPVEGASAVRLLAVDDNEINRGVIEHLALQLGYEIDLVEGGREAVERVSGGARYAVILMDCQMPDIDGYTATREIRAWEERTRAKRTPIVAVTAHALAGEEEKVRAAGMDAFLPKPVRLEALGSLLSTWTQARSARTHV
ncbi:MAG TPA: ATP-binding protein [Polyangiaceae bacterium]|nr:ATP-binding protein [Polyangiaceae bacterium]